MAKLLSKGLLDIENRNAQNQEFIKCMMQPLFILSTSYLFCFTRLNNCALGEANFFGTLEMEYGNKS